MKSMKRPQLGALVFALSSAAYCSISIAASAIPAQPAPYEVTPAISGAGVTISWQSSAPAVTAFQIERHVVGSTAWVPAGYIKEPLRSAFDRNVAPNKTYEYRVRAYRPKGVKEGYLSAVSAPITTPKTAPVSADVNAASTPRGVDAQPITATKVIITWKDVTSDETGFAIERRLSGGTWTPLKTVAPNVTVYADETVQAQTTYEYRVAANRPVGIPLPSEAKVATTPSATVQSIFFVDANAPLNADKVNPGTEQAPWRTIQKAADTLMPGQTVLVRGGLYMEARNFTVVDIDRSGTQNAWLTFKAYPGEKPKIKTTINKNYHGIRIYANYVIVDGFEVEGHAREITLEQAMAKLYEELPPFTNSNGITADSRGTGGIAHHIIIRNNYVHDNPLSGIQALGTDYTIIENNIVRNNSDYSPYGGSGMSVLTPRNFDNNTTEYKIILRGNISSGNINRVPCKCYSYKEPTDGNGIIIDRVFGTASNNYTGRILVSNNVVYDNGGSGIRLKRGAATDVFYNTAYKNAKVVTSGHGEINVQQQEGAFAPRIWNNIMVASDDRPVNGIDRAVVDFSYNIALGGNKPFAVNLDPVTGVQTNFTNRVNLDPKFVAVTGADAFKLAIDSPAVNTGSVAAPFNTDVYLAPRPRGGKPDVGAVESF
jgi:parallel beta-helix repeat protein